MCDTEGYTKSLDKLVSMSEKEYYVQLVDINRHQIIVARAILWLLVVVIGFDIASFEWFFNKVPQSTDKLVFLAPVYFFTGLSLILAVIAFYFAVMSIPAIGGYKTLHKNGWAEYSNYAYDQFDQDVENIEALTLNKILSRLDTACTHGSKTNSDRAIKLRTSSYLIISAVVTATAGFLIFLFKLYL
ncbi:hypothetical protein L2737_06155 [Shewanella electrodiphila]|uniref:Transmembrane protein n=1 Tax=Shewanella electrodiphila TaxID=934143 RepID=A0ABT0KM34_9GAMM|nr:hypothetical protein [Shewanella electrodiphila]MCL1044910.1 hypothetical protein [Shewanella electrodiphila]